MLIPDLTWLWRCGVDSNPPAELLRYWPGGLSIVFPRVGGGTVGVRVPDNPFLRQLSRCVEAPLYSTSVNRSGMPPLTHVSQILASFGRSVDLIVDGGRLAIEAPSTVVDATSRPCRLLRQGAVSIPNHVLMSA